MLLALLRDFDWFWQMVYDMEISSEVICIIHSVVLTPCSRNCDSRCWEDLDHLHHYCLTHPLAFQYQTLLSPINPREVVIGSQDPLIERLVEAVMVSVLPALCRCSFMGSNLSHIYISLFEAFKQAFSNIFVLATTRLL
jgi:hypothetical protein